MVADALKSLSITNSDASPIVENTTGNGAASTPKVVFDYTTPTTGGLASTSSKYKVIRLPTTAKLYKMTGTADAALDSSTGLVLDVGAYYSDSTTDGTKPSLQGTAISVSAFAALVTFQSTFKEVDFLTAFNAAKRQLPLWNALGLSSDPGGFIDVVVAVHTVATTPVSANLQVRADTVQY